MKIDEEIKQEVMRLNEAQQREVLAFAKALRRKDESGAGIRKEASVPENSDPHGAPSDE